MRYWPLLLLLTTACSQRLAPPKRWFPGPELAEVSGLGFADEQVFAHNDSGDGPFLYRMPLGQNTIERDTMAAGARDYEDLTSDPAGNWYIGDFGDNLRNRNDLRIYRFQPATGETDTIRFNYAYSSRGGNDSRGTSSTSAGPTALPMTSDVVALYGRQHNCEAMVYLNNYLHLFTKARAGQRGQYWTYHYRLSAEPGYQVAELVDSLYLNHRVVTGADIDSIRGQLLLTTYNYKRVLGFFPTAASSMVQLSNYPDGRFFQGQIDRRNLSWAIPNQVEAVAYFDERYFYIGRERTPLARARIKRKRRF